MTQPPISDITIAIDGPAASGKSTTAREVARQMNYLYIDTGAMYRAVTLLTLREGVDPENSEAMTILAEKAEINFQQAENGLRLILNGEDVSEAIRTSEVTRSIKPIAANPEVRELLVDKQRKLGENGGVVMDGRDIGTVVFPDAELKIYMEASVEARAERRLEELKLKETNASFEEIMRDLIARDESDMKRSAGPLRKADDAILIDTTALTPSEQAAGIVRLAKNIMLKREKTENSDEKSS
ncbi:MAG: (d)CMP kinase [Calditrichota bacterium]